MSGNYAQKFAPAGKDLKSYVQKFALTDRGLKSYARKCVSSSMK